MNNISQLTVFDYTEIEVLGDLERLKLVLENVYDIELSKKLENERGKGRDDYPVRVMLNFQYAMKVYGHRSVASFRRELLRNPTLRKICGLKDEDYLYLGKRKNLVPPQRVFTKFEKKLIKYQDELDKIFESDVDFMYEKLEGFGENTALDGKLLDSYAKRENKKATEKEEKKDYRRENEASWTCKTYSFVDGSKKILGILDLKHIYYVMQNTVYQYGKK